MTAFGSFSLPLAQPLATAGGTIDRREGFLVRLGDRSAGLGEATPLPGWTEPLADCRATLESTLAAVDGLADPADLPDLSATPAARHGLELALLDRAAKAAGVPLYRHLGGDRRVSAVPVNAMLGDADVDRTANAARDAVEQGFMTLKVKVGVRPIDEDVERVMAVREAVGAGVDIRVDANGSWTPTQAETAIEKFAWLGVTVAEQPLDADALDAHAALRNRGIAIALDESLREHGVAPVLEADAADLLVLKPMVLGGVGQCVELAERARERDIDVIVSTTIDAAVARSGAVHLAAALDIDRACGLATADWLSQDVADDPAPVVDGAISVPQSGGHGVQVEDLD